MLLRPRTFQVIIGLSLLGYAVNLFIFAMGRLRSGSPPVLRGEGPVDPAAYADPVPQALVLTAIVISFGVTAFFLVLAYRAYQELGTDNIEEMKGTDSND
ncbi:Na+/H+ antiporter subunit C [Exiguobacterium sp. UBA4551]|uniref:Na+/H+ antiporter subunit C n=1 Tax=Exiguobacterium sp. UBA4551 TaxID=1946494 RepID=UPI00257C77EF|nr:Na+/H+ antiporter subunit C [Exiguobacterium sp. UBA4551]